MPLEAGGSDSLSKTNPDAVGGEVNFGRVKIAAEGDYQYTVTESGLFPGVNNDPRATRNVTIKVRRLDGKLYALVGGDDFNYTNVFTPTPTQGQVELGKKISGLKPPKADPSVLSFGRKPWKLVPTPYIGMTREKTQALMKMKSS